jgi:hypothetical protein
LPKTYNTVFEGYIGFLSTYYAKKWDFPVKGRDWFDLVWYAAKHPELHLSHLEQRMRQTGHWKGEAPPSPEMFREMLQKTIQGLDVQQACREVEPFVREPENLTIWSQDFFLDIASRIQLV